MPILDGLENGYIRQHEGLLHAVGVVGTECFYERSSDGGATKSVISGAATQVKVCDCDAGARPVVEQYGSSELEVVVNASEVPTVWSSRDWGKTWAQVTGL